MVIASSLLGFIFQSNAVDDLWQRSVEIVRHSDLMIPGEVVMQQNVINGKGETESESKIVLEVCREGKGLRANLLSFVGDGKDLTEKKKKEIESELNEDINKYRREIPYHVEDPGPFIIGRKDVTKLIKEVVCIGYDFEVNDGEFKNEVEPFRYIGTVWIHPETAVPIQIERYLQDLPRKENGTEIMSLSQIVDFSYERGVWKKEREEEELWVNAKILFKKVVAVIRTHTDYQKHWVFISN